MTTRATVIRGEARALPLKDESVDAREKGEQVIYELIETVLSRGLTINGVTISLLPVRHAKPARQPRILSPRHRDTASFDGVRLARAAIMINQQPLQHVFAVFAFKIIQTAMRRIAV